MTANKDYVLEKRLIRHFVKDERSPGRVREVIFYEHVKGELSHYTVPLGETESKTMRDLRSRFRRGRGKQMEPTKFMGYFYRKFIEEIKRERKLMYGHPYRESSYMKWKRNG